MFAGHFAAGLLAKRTEPTVSLGTFVFAAMLSDLLWCIFMIIGVEHVQYGPGRGAANYLVSWYVPFSHSLVTTLIWAAVVGAGYFLIRRRATAAWLLFAVVLSHWVLDIITDRRIPLAPGLKATIGANLWRSLPATLIVEGGLWLAAIILYVRGTRAKRRTGVFMFWLGVVLITLVWYSNITGPPPPDPHAAPIVSLVLFSLLIAWAFWMNRARSQSASG